MTIKFPPLPEHEFLFKYLSLLSLFSSPALTEVEMKVLIAFALLPAEYEHFRFSPRGRKLALAFLSSTYNLSFSKQGLNNHVYSLIKKNYLYRAEDMIYVSKATLTVLSLFRSNSPLVINLSFPREVHTQEKD